MLPVARGDRWCRALARAAGAGAPAAAILDDGTTRRSGTGLEFAMADSSSTDLTDPALDPVAGGDLRAWRERYAVGLAGPRGPWSMAGLWWLSAVPQRLGSDAACEMRLPERCPPLVASLALVGDEVLVSPRAASPLHIGADVLDAPRRLPPDGVELRVGEGDDAVDVVLLRRGARSGVRAYDPRQGAAHDVRQVAWFAPTPGWVVDAEVEPAAAHGTLPIVNVLGDVRDAPLAGTIRFELGGAAWSLLAVEEGDAWTVSFRDATSGVTTYGAGRSLRVAPPAGRRVRVDLHRARHPPCAHTAFATCPLPPLANRIGLAVTAGERNAGR
jgi:uncharacterized protein